MSDDVKLWWHRYQGTSATGLEMTVTVGPSDKPPEFAKTVAFPMADSVWGFPTRGSDGPECTYVESFDHDPDPDDDDVIGDLADLTDDERAALLLDPECIYCLRPEREHTDPSVLHQFLAAGEGPR